MVNEHTKRGRRTLQTGRTVVLGLALAAVAGIWQVDQVRAADEKLVIVDRVFMGDEPVAFVEDEFIVVLSRDARGKVVAGTDADGRPTVNLGTLQAVIDRNGVTRFERQFPTAKPYPVDSKYPDLTGHYKVQVAPGQDLDRAMAAFERSPHVRSTEKIGIHPILVDPNDPFYRDSPDPDFDFDQWHYFDRDPENFSVQADLAWDTVTGSTDVIVGIADSGVRYFHSDIGGSDPPGPSDNVTNGNVFVNPGETPGNGLDDDGNGLVDDVVGYDFVTTTSCGIGCSQCCDTDCSGADNDPRDHNGHGTHVAGTVSAITNNNNRVAGVAGGFADGTTTGTATGVKILPLRIGYSCSCMGTCGAGFVRMDFAAAAFNYVADLVDAGHNVTAINCSWGSTDSGGFGAAVDAVLARDVMVIHAAGNSNSTSADFLGNKAGVMNVAATDRNGNGASFTNSGSWVDLAAPGVTILSTWHHFPDPANDYIAVLDGTSMAAPHAAGVAALLESCNSSLSGPDKFNLMVSTTRPYSDSRDLGSGIVNANNAIGATSCAGGCTSDADCATGEICCSGNCVVATCSVDADCDDADACTTDTCSNGGTCSASCSNAPINCDDADPCTADSCDSGTGTCVNDPVSPCCGDGLCESGEDQCNCSADCGTPPSTETNCSDGIDEDCDGATDCNDSDCDGDPNCPSCLPSGSSCSSDSECCSQKCRNGSCRGN